MAAKRSTYQESLRGSQIERAAQATADRMGGNTIVPKASRKSRRRSSIVTYFSEQKWSLLGWDVLNRNTGRPPNMVEKLWEMVCAIANFCLQYYLVYQGGAMAFLDWLGVENHDITDGHKLFLMVMFIENQIYTSYRSFFVFQSSVFSGLFSSFMIFLAVRGSWYFILNVTTFRGNGMLPTDQLILWSIPLIFFQVYETVADMQLADFVKRKQQGQTGGVRVMREGLWAVSRHPNMLGFALSWPFIAYTHSNNLRTTLFFCFLPHLWIFFQGIATNEGHMMRKYGKEYMDYMDEVPMLYPVYFKLDPRFKVNWKEA